MGAMLGRWFFTYDMGPIDEVENEEIEATVLDYSDEDAEPLITEDNSDVYTFTLDS